MSRIGRAPITVPAGVTVTVGEDNLITVKGAQGTLTYKAPATMTVKVEGNVVTVARPDDENESRADTGYDAKPSFRSCNKCNKCSEQ